MNPTLIYQLWSFYFRFAKIVQPLYPNALNLCEYYLEKNPLKTRELRKDTLSQMMSHANIHAGGKYLVVDDVGGLIVGAILERLGGSGVVVALHQTVQSNYEIVKNMNFTPMHLSCLYTCQYSQMDREVDSDQGKDGDVCT